MSTDGKEKIVLGSGKLYVDEFDKAIGIPEDSAIEKEENLLGLIQGGATLEYKPSFYEAKDDLGLASKVVLTEEEATLKSGIMTWCGTTLKKLCSTARVTEDSIKGKRTVKIGGASNQDGKKYVLRFIHEDKADGNIRITIVGNNQAGFSFSFAKDKETVIDAEFKAQPHDSEGTLIQYDEDIPKKDIPPKEELLVLTVTSKAGTNTGDTKITVSPELTKGNSYKYKIDTDEIEITYKQDCTSFTVWNGTDDITVTTGQYIAIVEVDSENKAIAAGATTITVA